MDINISELSAKKASLLFLDKIKAYISVMENFMTPEEITTRKEEITNKFNDLIYDYFLLQREINPDVFEVGKEVEMTPELNSKMTRFSLVKKEIEEIISDELGFVNFITKNFETSDSGLTYRSGDGKLHNEGINKSITYSVINTIALLKKKNNEPFEYPKELEPGDETTLFQIKDSISIDMMDIFKDEVLKDFFLGEGSKFNDKLKQLFIIDANSKMDAAPDVVAFKALKNMQDFETGIEASVENNDETYYSDYSSVIKRFKEITKSIDLNQAEEQKVAKGLK